MPTREQIEDVEREIENLIEGRFAPDAGWMRPSEAADAVPWSDLTSDQQAGVLTSELLWVGFDAGQIRDVSTRVIDGEPPDDWMNDIQASDQREQDAALFAEWREDAWARDHGRLPTPEELPRANEAARPDASARSEIAFTDAELDRLLAPVERLWLANDNLSPDPAREDILADSFMLKRELGFVGFRDEFFNDADAIKEWPDPVQRQLGLREAWDGVADYEAYRASLADVPTERLAEYRESLGSLLTRELGDQAVNLPAATRAEFDRRLDDAAEHGMSRVQGKGIDTDRGMDR